MTTDKASQMNTDGPVKMWLDDVRPAPDGWRWVRSYDEAVSLLEEGRVEEASLDHDLSGIGAGRPPGSGRSEAPGGEERTGEHVVLWMAERAVWPRRLCVHSANPVGRRNMLDLIERHHPDGAGALFRW